MDASMRVEGDDRAGVERLVRYLWAVCDPELAMMRDDALLQVARLGGDAE